MKKSSFPLWINLIYLKLKEIAGISEDTDIETTIQTISKSVEFKGVNVWILAFAVIVASVGLNVNSTAVIIGAMLISPLMGPINGIGLAIGISDSELLRKSLKNFTVMVIISIIASFTYFLISPLSDAQSELLARTRPSMYDVFIGFFGGLSGIIALSRKQQPFTVISGVAIATALMPPLCTAGYGLATAQISYFLGASYLFFINSFFIALATFLMVRFLHFPHKKYVDVKKQKFVKRTITLFSIVMIVPSIFMSIIVIKETSFNNQAIKYINDIQESSLFENIQVLSSNREFNRKSQTITISIIGKELKQKDIDFLKKELLKYGLEKTNLIIKQTGSVLDVNVQADFLENLLDRKEQQLTDKDSIIKTLENQIANKTKIDIQKIQIAKEMAVQYPFIKSYSIENTVYINTKSLEKDTIITMYAVWDTIPNFHQRKQLKKWLKIRLNVDTLKIIN
ncbi:MAG: DUF389 domain-containing protein [Bacteroidales bacterium]|jgi:uncharacterized hydrophobic protein (TIGR00271 family)|nr:DUF389 domain-containing protein [Bacteroidales bacterium]